MPSKQEMFEKAVRGLSSQGWRRCRDKAVDQCVYSNGQGMHCAWGWVDTDLKNEDGGGVMELQDRGIGIAGSMDKSLIALAIVMQKGHDGALRPENMLCRFRNICSDHDLIWPSDVPITLA